MSDNILPNHGVTGLSVSQDDVELFLDYVVEAEGIVAKVHDKGDEIEQTTVRDATIYYIDEKQTRLYQILNKIAFSANKYFKYDITGIEKVQIIHYKAPSNGYEYHLDIGPEGTAAQDQYEPFANEDYEGGEIVSVPANMRAVRGQRWVK